MGRFVTGRRIAFFGLLAPLALSGCASSPYNCSPERDRFDRARSTARANDREIHPVEGALMMAIAAANVLAGNRCR